MDSNNKCWHKAFDNTDQLEEWLNKNNSDGLLQFEIISNEYSLIMLRYFADKSLDL